MKRLGCQKTKTKVAGHQNCGICHPETKAGRTLEKRRWKDYETKATKENDTAS